MTRSFATRVQRTIAWPWLLVAILLLAFALRFYRLDAQSLWADEGTSVALAVRSLPAIAEAAAHDIHPPLYYFLLHFWVQLFGSSEIALRSLSVIFGTLLVPTTFFFGQRLFDTRVGLAAAFISAISPFQVYYSQEARMYILVALFGAISFYYLDAVMSPPPVPSPVNGGGNGWGAWIAYVLATIAALYTHYFAFTLVAAQNVIFVVWMLSRKRWRHLSYWAAWIVTQALIVMAYLPWLVRTWEQLQSWPAISEPFDLPTLLQRVFTVFSLGTTIDPTAVNGLLAGFLIIFVVGLIPHQGEGFVSTLYFLVPVLAMYVLSLQRPAYDPKLLLLATPGYYLLLARGVAGISDHTSRVTHYSLRIAYRVLRSAWPLASVAFVLLASISSLSNYYFDPRYARDDYRGIARTIAALSQSGDGILINAPGQTEIFRYYYHGDLPIYPLPRQRPIDTASTESELGDIAAKQQRLFTVLWATDESDPQGVVEGWLDQHGYKAIDRWYGNVRLALYATPLSFVSQSTSPLNVTFGDRINLIGYAIGASEARAGDLLPLVLTWRASQSPTQNYKVFVHMLDRHDHIVAQRDSEPLSGRSPTTSWQPGQSIADNYGLLVAPGTPPGEHRIEVGMYDLATGARLPVSVEGKPVGDRLLLSTMRVTKPTPPPIDALGMEHTRQIDFSAVRLLGYDFDKLGFEGQRGAPIRPGEPLHITLYWQALAKPTDNLALVLQVLDGSGHVWAEQRNGPVDGDYPAAQWEAGEIVRDQHVVFLPGDLPANWYVLRLTVNSRPFDLESFSVQP